MNTEPGQSAPLAQAQALFAAGRWRAARACLFEHIDSPGCAERLRDWLLAERQLERLPAVFAALSTRAGGEPELNQAIQRLLSGQAEASRQGIEALLVRHPHFAAAWHHLGRALQNLGQSGPARAAIERALQLQPDYPEAHYSLAHVLRAAGALEAAVEHYRLAVQAIPDFPAALLNLAITLSALERAEQALPLLQRLLRDDPEAIEARLNLGLCLQVLGHADQAAACYQQVLQRCEHPLAHFYLGCLYNESMQTEPARQHLQAALRLAPQDVEIIAELAGLFEQSNDLPAAQALVEQGLAIQPEHPALALEAARLQRRAGALDAARQRLLSIDAGRLPARPAQQYWFERGLLLDRCDDPAAAMQAFAQGNALAARSPRRRGIDPQAFFDRCDQLERWLAAGAAGNATVAVEAPAQGWQPAFLVGFPRSGTTLLDTMLDAHPAVASIEERATLEPAIQTVLDPLGGYPAALPGLSAEAEARLRAAYRAEAERFIPAGFNGLVLDKLPLRLMRVPLIRRLFPQAPLLFAQRHPCDVVLSNFMQQYVPNEAFIHFDTLADAARIYDRVLRLWRQMLETLRLPVHVVRYEALVEDPQAELQAACAALGLQVMPAMLDPAQRMAARGRVQTNSYQQVAEPVYRRAAGRWQRYRPWLEPLLPILRPHIEWLGYTPPD